MLWDNSAKQDYLYEELTEDDLFMKFTQMMAKNTRKNYASRSNRAECVNMLKDRPEFFFVQELIPLGLINKDLMWQENHGV
jgi:hypothetical protein